MRIRVKGHCHEKVIREHIIIIKTVRQLQSDASVSKDDADCWLLWMLLILIHNKEILAIALLILYEVQMPDSVRMMLTF
jgi:hypothetical protein